MAALYHSLFTEKGLELLRESIQNGTKLGITHMSFGDGGGELPIPDATFTQMVNEIYRVELNRLAPSKENANWLEADGVISSAIGGFNIREVGLWAGETMVAYANYPPTYKPTGDQGTAQIKTIRIVLQIDNTANFELKIDASVVMATIQSVNEAKQQALDFTADQVKDRIKAVASISELIQIDNLYDGLVVSVSSFHQGKEVGGDLFRYVETIEKNLHDGGYIIDPEVIFPSLDLFNTYYTPANTGTGCWIRLNNKPEIRAENYGLSSDNTAVWNCAAIQQALIKAASFTTPKTVTLGRGIFRTTNPIVISKLHTNQGNSKYYRVPKLKGAGRGSTELIKTTSNNVGSGYLTDNIDAVIFVCPKDGDSYSMYDEISGIGVYRYGDVAGTGYGFYLRASIYGQRVDLRAVGCDKGYFQTDCWMSQVNHILTDLTETLGIGVTSGTSVMGRNLYATNCKGVAIDITALTYSDLSVHADGCGTGFADGANAIQGSLTHGTRLLASVENHKGTEFYFTNSKGVVVTGRSYNTAAISTTAPKVRIDYESNVIFKGFDWEKTFNNLTQTEAEKYSFLATIGTPNWDFIGCTGNNYFKNFPYTLSDNHINGGKASYGYREIDRVMYSKVSFTGTTYKKAAYVGDCNRLFIEKAICTNPTYDRYFDSQNTGFSKSALSTNPSNPTQLSLNYYDAGVAGTIKVWGYVDANGWLWIRNDVADGNNLEYQFIFRK